MGGCVTGEWPALLITGHPDVPETVTVCCVLQMMLQKQLQTTVAVLMPTDLHGRRQLEHAQGFLVVLTRGVLEVPAFASLVVAVTAFPDRLLVPIVADSSFEFPDGDFYDLVRADSVLRLIGNVQDLIDAYQCLFGILACNFTVHGSMKIQWTEISEIVPQLAMVQRVSSYTRATEAPVRRSEALVSM